MSTLRSIVALAPFLAACGGAWQINELPSSQYPPTPEAEVRTALDVSEADLVSGAVPVAVALNRHNRPADEEDALRALRPVAGRRGATIVVRAAPARGQGLVAMRLMAECASS